MYTKILNGWSDTSAWDNIHIEDIRDGEPLKRGLGVSAENLISKAPTLLGNGVRRVWVPGCGTSLLPPLLAHLGFEVIATDISCVAVQYQRTNQGDFRRRWPDLGDPAFGGELISEVHDLREPFRQGEIDWIINVKVMQRFPRKEMSIVARSHFDALSGGGEAIFSTMNCQGAERDEIENALAEAGFVVPFFEINREYRRALQATGLPYAFVVGRPVLLRNDECNRFSGEQLADEVWRSQGRETLREIARKYETKMNDAAPAEQEKANSPGARLASIVYNTG